MRYKILNTIGQAYSKEARAILEKAGAVDYIIPTQESLPDIIDNYDAIVIGLGLAFDKSVLERADKLRAIATATTGLDHIDVAYSRTKGIEVICLKAEDLKKVTGTAELAFGLLLALLRHIPQSFEDVKAGNWQREKFLGNNVAEKTLGIAGLGRLGSLMAQYGKAFGMHVIAHDPHLPSPAMTELVDFSTLLTQSDIISIHVPLHENTKNMFNEQVFNQMKDGAYLVNTARGAIVNEADLLKALKSKKLAGYATDVLDGEVEFGKDASHHPLVQYARVHDNVIITPHIGGYTAESRSATDIIIAQKLAEALQKIQKKSQI